MPTPQDFARVRQVAEQAPDAGITAFRLEILRHARNINEGVCSGARYGSAERIEEAEAAVRDGHLEWRSDHRGDHGRWLTPLGRRVLEAGMPAEATGAS